MLSVAQWSQLQPQVCAVSTHEALLRSATYIVTVVTQGLLSVESKRWNLDAVSGMPRVVVTKCEKNAQ